MKSNDIEIVNIGKFFAPNEALVINELCLDRALKGCVFSPIGLKEFSKITKAKTKVSVTIDRFLSQYDLPHRELLTRSILQDYSGILESMIVGVPYYLIDQKDFGAIEREIKTLSNIIRSEGVRARFAFPFSDIFRYEELHAYVQAIEQSGADSMVFAFKETGKLDFTDYVMYIQRFMDQSNLNLHIYGTLPEKYEEYGIFKSERIQGIGISLRRYIKLYA